MYYYFQILYYQRHKEIYKHTILFEDVIQDPKKEIKRIFDLMKISHEHLPGALESLKEDSQRGTFGPRGRRPKVSDKEYAYLDSWVVYMGGDPRVTCQMDLDTMRQILDINDVPQYNLGPVKKMSERLVELQAKPRKQEERIPHQEESKTETTCNCMYDA